MGYVAGIIIEASVDTSGKYGPFDAVDASAIITMILECLMVFCNPDISIDVFQDNKATSVADILRPTSGALIASTLFDHITALGVNIPLAINILKQLSKSPIGRSCIGHGVLLLFSKAQGKKLHDITPELIMSAMQWLVTQYRTIKSQVQDENAKLIFSNLEHILKQVCLSMDDDEREPPYDVAPPAAVRFASVAKQASIHSRKARSNKFFLAVSGDESLKDCPTLLLFWKNFKARQVPRSAARNSAALQKYFTWEVAGKLQQFCMADLLHPWLTHPSRLLNEGMRAKMDKEENHCAAGYDLETLGKTEKGTHSKDDTPANVSDTKNKTKFTHEQRKEDFSLQIDLPEIPVIVPEEQAAEVDQDDAAFDLYADLYPAVADRKEVDTKENKFVPQEVQEAMVIKTEPMEEEQDDAEEPSKDEALEKDAMPETANKMPDIQEEENEEEQKREEEQEREQEDSLPLMSSMPSIPSDPKELEALLQDKEKIAHLLSQNPELLAALKAKLDS